ncbi:MAG: DNA-binding response regulator [Cytophagales bacterium]|nr:MAG: DNA-binding response regulator [Cytophagales bacterium]
MPLLRVLLFDDSDSLRMALSLLIGGTPGFEVVGDFPHAQNAVEYIRALAPDVVLMDIDMPGITGVEAVGQIRKAGLSVPVLILTVFDDDERVFTALRTGASGYLLKHTPPAQLLDAIRDVHEGGAPMTPAIARRVIQWLSQPPTLAANNLATLTERERQVLELLANGLSHRDIGERCGIGVETVRTHLKRIYEKLHVHSATEAVARFYRR